MLSPFVDEVLAFPQMLAGGRYLEARLKKSKAPRSIFIAGMGGSGVTGDIASDYLSGQLDIPIFSLRGYKLPSFARKQDLLVAISYSGNTEEVLSAVSAAKKRKLQIAAIASGGTLLKLAERFNYSFVVIPRGLQPRSALPYLLVALLKILESLKLIKSQDEQIDEAVKVINKIKMEFGPDVPFNKNPLKKIAASLLKKYPIIFSSDGLTRAAGYRLKCQFNENSKMIAHHSVFPELNHNEIVGLSGQNKTQSGFAVLMLRDKEEIDRLKKRIDITRSLLKLKSKDIIEVKSKGGGRLARLLSLVFTGDLLTVYLAELEGADPEDISVIEKLKKELKK